ncbi:hypothetical protein A9D60_23505 [Leisingera sp. JC1]|nr:hypothetical protein A9D60_23505 [Leisingera sp. JC1]
MCHFLSSDEMDFGWLGRLAENQGGLTGTCCKSPDAPFRCPGGSQRMRTPGEGAQITALPAENLLMQRTPDCKEAATARSCT